MATVNNKFRVKNGLRVDNESKQNIFEVNDTKIDSQRTIEANGATAADVPVIVKSRSEQTGDLQQWKNHEGTNLVRIDKDGHLYAEKLTTEDDVLINGNLTVNGTTTTLESIVAVIKDPVLLLGGELPPEESDAKDRGIEFRWHDETDPQVGFFGFDHSTGRFTFIPYAENDGEIFSGDVGGLDADHIQFATSPNALIDVARFVWDDEFGTLDLGLKGGNVVLQLGQEVVAYVHNDDVTTINKGDVVAITGSEGNNVCVIKAIATGDIAAAHVLGIAAEDIDAGEKGFVTVKGTVQNLDTYIDGTSEGVEIWLSDTVAGSWTINRPDSPSQAIRIGYIQKEDDEEGSLFVNVVLSGGTLALLYDVQLSETVNDYDVLRYDDENGYWVNTDISTVVNSIETIDAQNIVVSGNLTVETDGFIEGDLDVDGDLNVDGGDFTTSAETFNLLNTDATTINFGGEATIIEIGASTGTTNVNNDLEVDGDLTVDGGDIIVSTASLNLANTNATTINFGGAATDIQIGSNSGTTNVNNDLDVDGDLNVDGGDFTTSQSTFNLLNNTATTLNIGGAATTIEIGAATGTTNVNNNLDVDLDLNIDGGDLTTSATTFNLLNGTATTINFGGAATDIQIGAATGTTNINNNLDVDGDISIDGGDITASTTSFNLLNNTVTSLNFAGAATAITLGATTGETRIRHALQVDGNTEFFGATNTINPPTVSPPLVLGANALNQKVIGLNADLLDGQDGTWYQARENHTGTQLSSTISNFVDTTQQTVAPMFVHSQHVNLTATYNNVSKRVILTATGGGGGGGGADFSLTYWMGV